MTHLTPSASRLVARTYLLVATLCILAGAGWTASCLFGQPPAQKKQRKEEEEDTPKAKKPKSKIIPVEDDEPTKGNSKTPANRPAARAASGDLGKLAEQASNPALKALFRSLAVPHDVVLFKRPSVLIGGERKQREEKVVPIRFFLGNNPKDNHKEALRFTPLVDWIRDKDITRDTFSLESVHSYEEIAQDKVRQFVRETSDNLSKYERLVAAEQVLSEVLRWHASAVLTGEREGKEWDKIEKAVRKQLLDEVLLQQMKVLAEARDWDAVLKLAHRLATAYGREANQKDIFTPVADLIKSDLNNAINESRKQRARERLHELEMEFPDNPAFQPLSDALRGEAQILLKRAQVQAEAKDNEGARRLLEQAKKTWPQLPELGKFEAELNNESPVLRIGVRGALPRYFSPALACTDNEFRAVDMLFESLVKLVPDQAGGFRYHRGLAASNPKLVPLGRQFQLPRNARWSDNRPLTSTDIGGTLTQLRSGKGVGRSRVWGDLLAGAEASNDSSQVTLRMNQGFLDPLAPMAFKILPCSAGLDIDTEAFAKKPVTSGPFLLGPNQSDEAQRECQYFFANPAYGSRASKRGVPHIQEIRFYSYNDNTDLRESLSSGKLDLVLDLTAKEAEALRKNQGGGIVVPTPPPDSPNRRIYFLAVNTSKLEKKELRQALSCAIDREDLLKKHFRASSETSPHKALNGPFPADSWVYKPDNRANKPSRSLYDPDTAKALGQTIKGGPFTLKYVADSSAVDKAMRELCSQVKERAGIVLEPTPCDPYQLREDVEQTKNYDVAYYHYDFPDETYWLAPLFGPPPGKSGGPNLFKYHNVYLMQLLDETKSHRAFTEVRDSQVRINDHLIHELPLVPLWQLDSLLAYRREVRPAALDPLLLFASIEEWRMQRK